MKKKETKIATNVPAVMLLFAKSAAATAIGQEPEIRTDLATVKSIGSTFKIKAKSAGTKISFTKHTA